MKSMRKLVWKKFLKAKMDGKKGRLRDMNNQTLDIFAMEAESERGKLSLSGRGRR